MDPVTDNYSNPRGWAISDVIVRLRRRGTTTLYNLGQWKGTSPLRIGTSRECEIVVEDTSRRTSRYHAQLMRVADRWHLEDTSRNGIYIDGSKRDKAILEPGMEIEMGGVALVAESDRSIELRCYVERLFGFCNDEYADRVLMAIRAALRRRVPIVFLGNGELPLVVRGLYQCVLGRTSPFVVCDPRRAAGPDTESVRAPMNVLEPEEVLRASQGGVICFRTEELPREFNNMVEMVRYGDAQRQIVVCGARNGRLRLLTAEAVLSVPDLSSRGEQAFWVVEQFFEDARNVFGVKFDKFVHNKDWILKYSASSYSEVLKGTMRLTALGATEGVAKAAAVLGMKRESLRGWLESRGPLPFYVEGAPRPKETRTKRARALPGNASHRSA